MKNSNNQPSERIYLKFNNACVREQCDISGESFKPEIPLAFFLNNDYGLPVTPEIAFKRGFVMDSKDFAELETVVLRDNCKDTTDMVSVNLSLPVCMKIWMSLDELFKILKTTTEGTETSLWELYDFKSQLQTVIFSVLRSTKEFQQHPIVLTEQPPVYKPDDDPLPF